MQKEKVRPEDYLSLKKIGGITASERRVAWTVISMDPVEGKNRGAIELLDLETGEHRQFTAGNDQSPKFSPDGKYLAFISRRGDNPQLYIMDLEFGGEAKQITSEENGVTSFSWAPGSQKIAYTARYREDELVRRGEKKKFLSKFEKEQEIARKKEEERRREDPRVIDRLVYRSGTSYHDGRKNILFVLDVGEAETAQVSSRFTDHSTPEWLSDSEIVVSCKLNEPTDLNTDVTLLKFELGDEPSEGEELLHFKIYFPPLITTSPGGRYITYFDLGEKSLAGSIPSLMLYDTRSRESRDISAQLDRSVVDLEWEGEESILLVVEDEGTADIRRIDVRNGTIERIYRGEDSVISVTKAGDTVFFTATGPLHPWAVWKLGEEKELVHEPNEKYLEEHEIITPEEMWFESPSGFKFQGWFFEAKSENGERPPLALHIHGGPHVMWTPAGSMWHEFQCFLASGYSVLATNPQGSSGYGEKFTRNIVGKWGVEDSRDILIAVDAIADRVDQERLFVLGGSYAGFQTANLISRDNRFRAAVAQRGVYDLVTFPLTTDIPLWGFAELEGTPWEKLQDIWELSPVARAKEIETPLMIIAAENDFRVAISQSEELFAALKLQGKEAVFVRYPRDGHELSRSGEPLHVVDRIKRMIEWFDSHQ